MIFDRVSDYFVVATALFIFIMFYVITFKHFIVAEKVSFIRKLGITVLLTVINPLVIDTFYEMLFEKLSSLIGRYYSSAELDGVYITVSLVIIIVSVLLNISFAFLYAFIVKGDNIGVSVFTYFMLSAFVVSVDNMMQPIPNGYIVMGEITGAVSIVLIILLVLFFYKRIVVPFSKLTYTNKEFDWKFFMFPPTAILIMGRIILALSTQDFSVQFYLLAEVATLLIVTLTIVSFDVMIKNSVVLNKEKEARSMFKELSVEMMEALAHTIDAKDEYTKGHSTRVAKYSKMLAEKMGMNEEECENVYYMALLHDIGKIGVPNEIINSPNKLTDEEYDVIKTHPGIGYDILSEIKIRPDLSIGARWHHERYDGKGYPDGKSGDDLPIWARIIAVADSYDAMTSNRSYRKYMPQDAVREELVRNSGSQFDPDIAEQMIAIIDEDKDYILHE